MPRTLLPLAIAALCLTSASAEEAKQYDLNSAITTALANHPSLRGAEAKVAASEAQKRQAKSGYAPKVEATLGYTQLQEDPSFTIAPFGTLVYGETDNKQASVTAQYPLSTGGKLRAMNRQATAGVHLSQEELARQRQKVALDASTAYFNVLKAKSMVEVANDQLKALTSQRDAIGKMLKQGVVTRIDLLRAETGVSGAEEFVTKAKNGEALATAALANAMGLPADAKIEVAEAPAATDEVPLPTQTSAAFDEALKSRPELRGLDAQRDAANAGTEVAKSARRPTLGLFAQYDLDRPTFMPETGDWTLGLVAKMNLFDGGATKADVARAASQVAQVEAGAQELRNGIQLQVTQALLNLDSARERVKTTEKAVATAEEGVRLVKLGYENGVNTITDFLASQAELTKARTDLIAAQNDVHIAEAQLRFALGREPTAE